MVASEFVKNAGIEGTNRIIDDEIAKSGRAKKAAETRRKNASEKAAKALEDARQAAQTIEIPNNFGRVQEPLKIKKETERAVMVDGAFGRSLWLPKSQVKIHEGKFVVAMSDWVGKKHGVSLSMSKAHEDNLRAYKARIAAEREETARSLRESYARQSEEATARRRREEDEYLRTNGLSKTKLPSSLSYKGAQITYHGEPYEVTEVHGRTHITGDDPSLYGAHLLGEEETTGNWVYLKPIKK